MAISILAICVENKQVNYMPYGLQKGMTSRKAQTEVKYDDMWLLDVTFMIEGKLDNTILI